MPIKTFHYSLSAGTKSVESPNVANSNKYNACKTTSKSVMARASGSLSDSMRSKTVQTISIPGHLIDDGAPYSAICYVGIQLVKEQIGL